MGREARERERESARARERKKVQERESETERERESERASQLESAWGEERGKQAPQGGTAQDANINTRCSDYRRDSHPHACNSAMRALRPNLAKPLNPSSMRDGKIELPGSHGSSTPCQQAGMLSFRALSGEQVRGLANRITRFGVRFDFPEVKAPSKLGSHFQSRQTGTVAKNSSSRSILVCTQQFDCSVPFSSLQVHKTCDLAVHNKR